jgi:hypothetical protein
MTSSPRSPLTGQAGHGGPPAQTAGRVSTAAAASPQVGTSTAIAVNCPPLPGASVRDPGSGRC